MSATMTLSVYRLDTGEVVDVITADTNAVCERQADERWGSNDYGWTYCETAGVGSHIDLKG